MCVCVQYNCHVSFSVSGYLHKESREPVEMSAVMWVIKNYKTEVITRNPASTQAVPQSLWLHLFCLNPSHIDWVFGSRQRVMPV